MPTEDLKPYVDHALKQAEAYIAKNPERLRGKNDAETKDIQDFLKTDPYSNEKVKGAVGTLIEETTKHAKSSDKQEITYLSGSNGAMQLINKGMQSETSKAHMNELNKHVKESVKIDFSVMKPRFAELAGLENKSIEPYGKWRALMSGTADGITKLAQDKKLSFVRDDTLAPSNEEAKKYMLGVIKEQQKTAKVSVFAVALTPEQSKAEAEKLGISGAEAEKNADRFHSFFNDVKKNVADVTLVDKDMNIIYQQKGAKVVALDLAKMQAWDKSFREEKPAEKEKLKHVEPADLSYLQPSQVGGRASSKHTKIQF